MFIIFQPSPRILTTLVVQFARARGVEHCRKERMMINEMSVSCCVEPAFGILQVCSGYLVIHVDAQELQLDSRLAAVQELVLHVHSCPKLPPTAKQLGQISCNLTSACRSRRVSILLQHNKSAFLHVPSCTQKIHEHAKCEGESFPYVEMI